MNTDVTPLFEPLHVRGLTLKNRIVMSAMTRRFSPGGIPGEDVAAYYARRATSGTGLIITEGTGIDDPAGLDDQGIPVMHGAALEGWRRVTDAVHAAGGIIFPQFWHQGVLRDPRISARPELPNRGPSGILGPLGKISFTPEQLAALSQPSHALSESEIGDLIAAFARAASDAISVGFDGIALHGGHGYLIDSFLWAGTNRRTDEYGGDPARRARFATELVKAIRAAIGLEVPILFRFSLHKQQDYLARLADTPNELGAILGPIADAGVDIFDASLRRFETPTFEGSDLNLAGWAKKLTGKLSMTVGGIGLAASLEESFATGVAAAQNNLPAVMARFNRHEFDLVGVARAILADPAWVEKARSGAPFLPFTADMLRRLE